MANGKLPSYLASATPNPAENRAPWYKNTAPAYAGIFLGVPFMAGTAAALQYGSLWAGVVGLIIGALFCYLLYHVPAMLGLKTGMPLYVVGSSTFGTHGGILMPGLIMGVLQIGWHAFMTFAAVSFLMKALGYAGREANPALFWVLCFVWGLALALVGAVGIKWLGKLSSFLPVFPLAMIIIAAFANMGGLASFKGSVPAGATGLAMIPVLGLGAFAALQAIAGFFATAGAAGADFAMNSRNEKDVVLGGFFGITIAGLVTGLFAMMLMAGAMGEDPAIAAKAGAGTFDAFIESIAHVGGWLALIMYWVFVAASICPTGFCAFIFANSFSTMFPKLPRVPLALVAGLIGAILAATGWAAYLTYWFVLIGASFGPVIGAMTAEYLRNGKWMGPRKGINWAGYIAWAVGLVVGILGVIPYIGFSYGLSTLMSFIVGFTTYLILAVLGLEPPAVEFQQAAAPESAPAE